MNWAGTDSVNPNVARPEIVREIACTCFQGGTGFDDLLAIDVEVRRWGTTSFDVGYEGSVGERPVFSAVVTYISVTPGTTTPAPVPDAVRSGLG